VRSAGLSALPWSRATTQLRERLQFMHHADPESWPDVSDETLRETLSEWLGPFVDGVRRLDELARLDLTQVLWTRVGWHHKPELDALAPTHLEVPSGSRIPLDYSDPQAPVLAVRLQEVFGLTETPRIGGGRVPVTLHLLSPAQRPVQVTSDLASFWRDTYFDVKKELKGRYPKHYWPDDPLTAQPTRRVRPKEKKPM
jgi:ATP-dependent helicase HrpB